MTRNDPFSTASTGVADAGTVTADPANSETGAVELSEFGGTASATVYKEFDLDADGTYEASFQISTFSGDWVSELNSIIVANSQNHRIKILNTSGGTGDFYAEGIEVDSASTSRNNPFSSAATGVADGGTVIADPSNASTGAIEISELGGTAAATVYKEIDVDGDGTYEASFVADTFSGSWHVQLRALKASTDENSRLKITNTSGGAADYFLDGIEVDSSST